jgi:hypothetical protein
LSGDVQHAILKPVDAVPVTLELDRPGFFGPIHSLIESFVSHLRDGLPGLVSGPVFFNLTRCAASLGLQAGKDSADAAGVHCCG